jgi:flagellar biosynthesis protein FliR
MGRMGPLATWFALVLARVGTGVAVMPLFGGRNTPRLVRLGLALVLAVFWFTALDAPPDAATLQRLRDSWLGSGMAVAREMILGAVIGFAFNLFLIPARIAGEFLTQEMGLSLAATLGPTSDRASGPITLIFESLSGLLFLGLDLHHVFLATLHTTFVRYPIGGLTGSVPTARLLDGAVAAQEMGVLIAGPLAVVLFLVVVSLALMARAAPQLNVYAVGFGLQAVGGIVGALVLMPELLASMTRAFGRVSEYVVRLL